MPFTWLMALFLVKLICSSSSLLGLLPFINEIIDIN